MNNKKSKIGVAAIIENRHNFDALISEMKATGKKFPVNQFGEPNISWVAKEIPCTTGTLRAGTLEKPFKEALLEIGVDIEPSTKNQSEKLAKKAEDKSKEATRLRRELNAKIKEVEGLRLEVEKLHKKLQNTKFKKSEEELRFQTMLKEGVRFIL